MRDPLDIVDGEKEPGPLFISPCEPYWTRQRRDLIQWMKDRAPSFVQGYVGAVRLLYMPSFPARVHFICHAVRDIYSYLPAALGTKRSPRPSEVFPPMVKELVKRWKDFIRSQASEFSEADSDFRVSPQVYNCIAYLVRKSDEISGQPTVGKQLVVALFRSLDRQEDEFVPPWITKSFDAEYDFFVKRAHLARSVDEVPNDDGLVAHFEAFERALHSLVGPYFSGKEELDAILQDTNEAAA